MRGQTAISDELLWEAGMERGCVTKKMRCRFEPCTVAQGVRCCAECRKCHAPCTIATRLELR